MPAAMHSFYLRSMYHQNVFKEPGGITLADVPIDLRKVKFPTYFLSTREDHIAPWRSTYAGPGCCPVKPEAWLSGAVFHEGSWWEDWANWISDHAGTRAWGWRANSDRRCAGVICEAAHQLII
jgi:polyhydroxyalkanoate synthase